MHIKESCLLLYIFSCLKINFKPHPFFDADLSLVTQTKPIEIECHERGYASRKLVYSETLIHKAITILWDFTKEPNKPDRKRSGVHLKNRK
jgi:hypothetical protein